MEESQPASSHIPTPTHETFGWLLRRYRLAAGLTQEELAERAGLSVAGLSALEGGKRQAPYRHTVIQLAQALSLTAGETAALEAAVVRSRTRATSSSPVTQEEEPATGQIVLQLVPAPPERHDNLPTQLTSFIGREREQAEVMALLERARLVTLTGPGGAGKTRLALTVAAKLVEQYPDGVWLVELAPLADPILVPRTVAQALGLHEQSGHTSLEMLVDYLGHRCMLLVVDNCEHLVSACAELATALLRRCPQLRLLATSRETLEVAGEVLFRVPSLAVPNLDHLPPAIDLTQYEAVQLFLERAQARRADFALSSGNAGAVAQICTRLDGMPLALELAAARIGSVSVETIATRLDDRFRLLTGGPRTVLPRHQTLRAALDWSHDLLSLPEQTLLRRLAVFAGSFTLEAAEAVCAGQALAREEILDLLSALINKSLVQAEDVEGSARYRLLETVRQYGQERLVAASEAAAVRDAHLAYFLALAERAEPELQGPEQVAWLARLNAKHDNLRAALQWAAGSAQFTLCLKLAGLLWRFWWTAGYLGEGRHWLDMVLQWDAGAAPRDRLRALQGAGVLACYQGDFLAGTALLEECLSQARTLGEPNLLADVLITLANGIQWRGGQERAAVLLEEALALYRALGDQRGIADALLNLATATLLRDDYRHALQLAQESLQLCHGLGNSVGIALALGMLGEATRAAGDLEQARFYYSQSLALERALDNRLAISALMANLALVACMIGDLDSAEAYSLRALAGAVELGDRWGTAYCLEAMATVVCARSDAVRAARLFGSAAALRDRIGVPLPGYDRKTHYDRALAVARKMLGEQAFAEAWALGFYTPTDQVAAEILAE